MKNVVKLLLVIFLSVVLICNFSINTYAISEFIESNKENVENNEIQNEENTVKSEQQDKIENSVIEEEKQNNVNNQEENTINGVDKEESTTSDNSVTEQVIDTETQNEKINTRSVTTYNSLTKTKENGIYKMAIGKDSNKTIEVAGSDIGDNAKVDIWDFGNVTAQKFYFEYDEAGFYKITVMHTGKSLTVKGNNLVEGAEIVQYDYQGLDSQKWILRDTNKNGWVISLQSNPDLSISVNGNIANGSKIILSKTKDNDNQMLWLYDITATERTHTDGIYKMSVGVNINKAIEVSGSSKEDNAKVDIWDFGNATAQKFNLEYKEGYYKITARHTGKSLTAKGGKIEEGTQVVQADYQGLDSQKWILRDSNKNGWIISPSSNPSLSISIKGNIENGAILELSKTQDNNNQMFALYNITAQERTHTDGIYKIAVGKDSSKTIEVAGSDTGDNAKVDIWNYGNVPAQKFYFEYEEGFYKITAMHTGKSLTVKGNNLAEGAEIVQYDYQGLDSQKWILRDTGKNGWVISLLSNPRLSIGVEGNISNGSKMILSETKDNDNQMFWVFNINSDERTHADGIYKIAVGKDSSKTIEVAGSSTANNAKVDIWNYGNVDAQRFNLQYLDGFYKITAVHTGKSLTVKDNNLVEGAEIVQYDYQGLDSQKWILRDSNKNGWIISPLSKPNLAISVKGSISNGSILTLSKTQDNDNQMFYISQYVDKNIKDGLYGKSGLMYKGTGGSYLKYYQIGRGSKHLFLGFAIHGFEDSYSYDGQELTYIADQFYNYLKNNMPDDLVEEWTIYILPSINPDGEYNGWTNNGPGRTTVYSWAPGNQGIDMNRCFPVGYKSISTQRNYTGTQALQAYEAQSLRDFILNNTGSQNIVIDVHGWLNETIGDYEIGKFYRSEFGISEHVYSYGAGYLINWARSIPNTRSMLLELPEVSNHNQTVSRNYVGKFTNATINLLRNF